jgi:adenosylcobinamide-phosphate synthase
MEPLLELWRFQGFALLLGCFLDWLFGDPLWLYHPVRMMGHMISWLEGKLRRYMGGHLLAAGGVLVCIMCLFWFLIPACILYFISFWPRLLFLLESFFCYQLLAAKSLKTESMKVAEALKEGKVEDARRAVSMIVGRDTGRLDEAGIARAAVETVAENASDGVTAPFLFMALLGPAGGFFYKAVNTMDSMVGYKNDRYLLFGRAAAKLDDVLNFIPARVTGFLMAFSACFLPGCDGRNAFRIFFRDRKKHASPNSAHGEAACAGALGIRLAGDAWYFGKLHKKPYIGDELRPIRPEDIKRACLLMYYVQAILMLLLLTGLLAAG